MKDVTGLVRGKNTAVTKNIPEIHSLSSKRKDSSILNCGTDSGTDYFLCNIRKMTFEWVVRPYMRRADWPLSLSLFLSKTAVLGSAAVGSVFFSSPFLRVFGLVLRGLWVGPVLVGVNWEVWSKLFCCLASAIQHHIMRWPHTIKLMSRKVSFLYALMFKGLGGIIFCCFWKCFLLSKAAFIWSVSFLFEYI